MEFMEFAKKAIILDKRNSFSRYSGDLSAIPEEMKDFYREVNPTDVEVGFVRFAAAEELTNLQAEYAYLEAQFVFATSNGDPVFIKAGCVYTYPHGVKDPPHELLAPDIKAYLSSLIEENT